MEDRNWSPGAREKREKEMEPQSAEDRHCDYSYWYISTRSWIVRGGWKKKRAIAR